MIDDKDENTNEPISNSPTEEKSSMQEKRKEVNLVKHTETIDRLVIQNKQLQKELHEADLIIDELEHKLGESSIKISKNLFYAGLLLVGYLVYSGNAHMNAVNNRIVEMNTILTEYKQEIEKSKLYNEILEKRLNIKDDNTD